LGSDLIIFISLTFTEQLLVERLKIHLHDENDLPNPKSLSMFGSDEILKMMEKKRFVDWNPIITELVFERNAGLSLRICCWMMN
jgi:hypothetical protein